LRKRLVCFRFENIFGMVEYHAPCQTQHE
jgi:hypothetical protein